MYQNNSSEQKVIKISIQHQKYWRFAIVKQKNLLKFQDRRLYISSVVSVSEFIWLYKFGAKYYHELIRTALSRYTRKIISIRPTWDKDAR